MILKTAKQSRFLHFAIVYYIDIAPLKYNFFIEKMALNGHFFIFYKKFLKKL